MTLPALVLVHGGAHAADCWDLTVDEIHRLAPDLDVLAVDLPGRRNKPGDLRTLTVGAACVLFVAAINRSKEITTELLDGRNVLTSLSICAEVEASRDGKSVRVITGS